MNSRPKSEEPVELVAAPHYLVSGNGYRWVRGESGFSKPNSHLFLVENSGDLADFSITPPGDFYLELAQLDISEESTQAFAAKFGVLGLPREHFHSTECRTIMGESAPDWGLAITEFQFSFNLWRAVKDRDLKTLRRMLTVVDSTIADKRLEALVPKDLPKHALRRIVDNINRHLDSGTPVEVRQGCFKDSCCFSKRPWPSSTPRQVSYRLRVNRKGDAAVHLTPSCLLVTAWLQFAEVVCGERTFRPCDVCHRLMDVSEAARPGAKRMHDRCSLAERMRRYRFRLNSAESSGPGVKASQIRKGKRDVQTKTRK